MSLEALVPKYSSVWTGTLDMQGIVLPHRLVFDCKGSKHAVGSTRILGGAAPVTPGLGSGKAGKARTASPGVAQAL